MTLIRDIYNKHSKIINYIFFACIITLINVLSYILFYNYIYDNALVSNIVAYTISISISFIINKKYVFKNDNKKYLKQIIFFLIVKLISFGIDSAILLLLKDILKWNNLLSKIIANASTTISNYFLNNNWVFKDNK